MDSRLLITIVMVIIGFIITCKPDIYFKIQNPISKVHELPKTSDRVKPIYIRILGFTVICLALVMYFS